MKIVKWLIVAIISVTFMVWCSSRTIKNSEETTNSSIEYLESKIKDDLQGMWLANNSKTGESIEIVFMESGKCIFDTINGSYAVNLQNGCIDVKFVSSDAKLVTSHLPYKYENGKLKLYNNSNGEIVKK